MRTNYNNAAGNSPKTDEMQRNVMRSKATSQFFVSSSTVVVLVRVVCVCASQNSLHRTNARVKLHFRFFRASNYGKINFIFSFSLLNVENVETGLSSLVEKTWLKCVKSRTQWIWLMSRKLLAATARWSLAKASGISFHVFFFIQSASVNLIQLLSVVCTSSRIHSSTHSSRVFSHIYT